MEIVVNVLTVKVFFTKRLL
ncbi:unnamed protein product [Oikopleura dioica]|uniref:Uncharacterized protein n=1 Tax=Oikopleura dioica TaxID=34765 RepID=E4YMC3_OIKDI|nr:unnamed protein product [Oikopleura dioica]